MSRSGSTVQYRVAAHVAEDMIPLHSRARQSLRPVDPASLVANVCGGGVAPCQRSTQLGCAMLAMTGADSMSGRFRAKTRHLISTPS